MQGKWRFYFTNVNYALASLFVDLDARDIAPDPSRPHLLWVWVAFKAPREDGLSSQEESATLFAIEDDLNAELARLCRAQCVGRITTQGRREFYYYAPSPAGLESAVASTFSRHPDYRVAHGEQPDPEWTRYLNVLYPSQDQLDEIENAEVIRNLNQNGDALTDSRPIDHFAYFPEQSSADVFASQIVELGYSVSDRTHREDAAENPFGVIFQREDVPSLRVINAVTQELRALAFGLGGEYDGWETYVVSSKGR